MKKTIIQKVTLALILLLISLSPITVIASSLATDADVGRNATEALEGIGLEFDFNIAIESFIDVERSGEYSRQHTAPMPQLRPSSYHAPDITSETDVDTLLNALEAIFSLTDSSIHIDIAIIDAIDNAGLREYWIDGLLSLLRRERDLAFGDYMSETRQNFYSISSSRPIRTFNFIMAPMEVWLGNNWLFMAYEYDITHRNTLESHLDIGSHNIWTSRFNLHRAYRSSPTGYQRARGVILWRNSCGDAVSAFRNFSAGEMSVRGTIEYFIP